MAAHAFETTGPIATGCPPDAINSSYLQLAARPTRPLLVEYLLKAHFLSPNISSMMLHVAVAIAMMTLFRIIRAQPGSV